MGEKDNIIEETVEFSQELYEKNIKENTFVEEYERGDDVDANN